MSTKEQQRARFWPTSKAYEALGLPVPPEVAATDAELGQSPERTATGE